MIRSYQDLANLMSERGIEEAETQQVKLKVGYGATLIIAGHVVYECGNYVHEGPWVRDEPVLLVELHMDVLRQIYEGEQSKLKIRLEDAKQRVEDKEQAKEEALAGYTR